MFFLKKFKKLKKLYKLLGISHKKWTISRQKRGNKFIFFKKYLIKSIHFKVKSIIYRILKKSEKEVILEVILELKIEE